MRSTTWSAVSATLMAACGDPITQVPDSGPATSVDSGARDSGSLDASVTPDASGFEDAGEPPLPDAGPGVDAGPPGSPGCALADPALSEGEQTFRLDDRDRRYVLRLPEGYSQDRAWPLVLALHGNGGSTSYWDGTRGSGNIRSVLENDAVLIVAEAIDGRWRDYDMPRESWPARIELELAYFEEVLGQARDGLCLAEGETFAMGFSGGGSFSGVLGCRRDDIRAIAVGGSVIYFDEDNCIGQPAAWITIGEGELSGGREAYRDFWRDRAGCDASSTATAPDPCTAYDGCTSETPVHYCQHPGGHVWPDFGAEATWGFFSRFVDGANR